MFPKTHKDSEISVRLGNLPRTTQLVRSIVRWSAQYCLSVPWSHSRPHYFIFVGLVIFWKTFLRIITALTRIIFLFLKTSIIMQCPNESLLKSLFDVAKSALMCVYVQACVCILLETFVQCCLKLPQNHNGPSLLFHKSDFPVSQIPTAF